MNADASFLSDIMVSPRDALKFQVYADWLEEHDDPRSQLLRLQANFDGINYIDWLKLNGNIGFYLERSPEIRRLACEQSAFESTRKNLETLSSQLDDKWVSFVRTLGRPFEEFFFFNNHGDPRECQPEELPFKEPIGTRGAVITFATAFASANAWDSGLMSDLTFLRGLELTECEYGAATCPVHPFICELEAEDDAVTAADVLNALKARNFRSEHILDLNAKTIPFPGYNPGTENDEIHNDFSGQYVFAKGEDQDSFESDEQDEEFYGAHGVLKRYVAGQKLWYVNLHTTPEQVGEYQFSRYAILLAVGLSPSRRRLIGAITHQVCHNLCD